MERECLLRALPRELWTTSLAASRQFVSARLCFLVGTKLAAPEHVLGSNVKSDKGSKVPTVLWFGEGSASGLCAEVSASACGSFGRWCNP